MPELGKATYELIFNTSQVGKMEAAETTVVGSTDAMDKAIADTDANVLRLGVTTGMMAAKVSTDFKEAGAGAAAGAEEISAAGKAAGAAGATAAAGATKAESAWVRFGKVGGKGNLGLVGLAAAYFAIKGGITYIKDTQQALLLVANATHNLGRITGVTTEQVKGLAEAYVGVQGQTYATNLQTGSLLARYTKIRNLGPGMADIYKRAFIAVQDVVAGTGRNARMVAIAIGKALQDPAKNLNALSRAGITFSTQQKAMISNWIAQNQVVKAQNYILGQLESRYGGAAQTNLKSFNAQWTLMKENFDKATAAMMHSLEPAFRSLMNAVSGLASLMGRHTTIVRDLVLAFVGLKIAAIASRTAMLLLNSTVVSGIKAFFGYGAASKVAATEVEASTTEMAVAGEGAASLMGVAFAGMWVAIVAGGALAVYKLIQMIGPLKRAFNGLGGAIGSGLSDLINGKPNSSTGPGAGNSLAQRRQIDSIRARYQAYRKAGVSEADALRELAQEYPGFTLSDLKIIAPGARTPVGGKGKVKAPIKAPTNAGLTGLPKDPHGLGLIPVGLQIAEDKALMTKTQADDKKVYVQELAYLHGLLAHRKLTQAQQLNVWNEIASVTGKMQTITNSMSAKAKKGAYTGLIPEKMALAYQKALLTTSLKDDEKVLKEEETYLAKLIASRKLHGAKLLKAATELAQVKKKLAADLKKTVLTGQQAMDKEMQSFVDTRGSFFSQFASSVFHVGGGGLEPGAAKSTTINQNNSFQEVPKDRFALSRQMARAASGV